MTAQRGIVTLAAVGDFMPVGVRGDPATLWAPVPEADLVLVNFECPVTGAAAPRARKTYNFKASSDVLDRFDRRFVLHLANNHIMDFGEEGLRDTLRALRARGIACAGAGCSLAEAAQPLIVERCGLRIGFVCAADPRFESAGAGRPGTAPADENGIGKAIEELKASGAAAIVSLHMGMEFFPYPTAWMERLAKHCVETGAAAVLFHHSHCLSGLSRLSGAPVLWGLGNYLFSPAGTEGFKPWYDGAAWTLKLNAATGRVEDVRPVPVELDAGGWPGPASETAARRIRTTIDRLSRRMPAGRCGPFHRALGLLSPSYFLTTGRNHLDSLRNEGIRRVWDGLRFTLRSHLRPPRAR